MSDISLFIDDVKVSAIDDVNTSEATTKLQDELTIGLVQSIGKDHADLSYRELTKADLRYANLEGADLSDAVLFSTNLIGANLNGADLTDALWANTTCPDGSNSNNNPSCGF